MCEWLMVTVDDLSAVTSSSSTFIHSFANERPPSKARILMLINHCVLTYKWVFCLTWFLSSKVFALDSQLYVYCSARPNVTNLYGAQQVYSQRMRRYIFTSVPIDSWTDESTRLWTIHNIRTFALKHQCNARAFMMHGAGVVGRRLHYTTSLLHAPHPTVHHFEHCRAFLHCCLFSLPKVSMSFRRIFH